jgi:hypothetical protein
MDELQEDKPYQSYVPNMITSSVPPGSALDLHASKIKNVDSHATINYVRPGPEASASEIMTIEHYKANNAQLH